MLFVGGTLIECISSNDDIIVESSVAEEKVQWRSHRRKATEKNAKEIGRGGKGVGKRLIREELMRGLLLNLVRIVHRIILITAGF